MAYNRYGYEMIFLMKVAGSGRAGFLTPGSACQCNKPPIIFEEYKAYGWDDAKMIYHWTLVNTGMVIKPILS